LAVLSMDRRFSLPLLMRPEKASIRKNMSKGGANNQCRGYKMMCAQYQYSVCYYLFQWMKLMINKVGR
jgi:hypothetical protein